MTAQVTQIERQACVNPATDTFGPRVLLDGTDRPVGVGLGTGGSDVIETFFPLNALPPSPGNGPKNVRLGVTSLYLSPGGGQEASAAAPAGAVAGMDRPAPGIGR